MKSNPLLANVPPGNPTPGNIKSNWFMQDFRRVAFNGTRQFMRPPREARPTEATLGVRTSPRCHKKVSRRHTRRMAAIDRMTAESPLTTEQAKAAIAAVV